MRFQPICAVLINLKPESVIAITPDDPGTPVDEAGHSAYYGEEPVILDVDLAETLLVARDEAHDQAHGEEGRHHLVQGPSPEDFSWLQTESLSCVFLRNGLAEEKYSLMQALLSGASSHSNPLVSKCDSSSFCFPSGSLMHRNPMICMTTKTPDSR